MNVLDKQLKFTSKFFVNILITENVCDVAKNMYHTRKVFSFKDLDNEYNCKNNLLLIIIIVYKYFKKK